MPKMDKEISSVVSKNVRLIGFDDLDESEQFKVQEIMATYIKKIEERTPYEELKLRLKQHQRAKMFIHEISAQLFLNSGTALSATSSNKNMYRALTEVMEKLVNEITHKEKKSHKERPVKKFNRKVI